MPAQNEILECGRCGPLQAGMKEVQPAASRKMLAIVERAPRDLALDYAHLRFASAAVLRSIWQSGVFLAPDSAPGEIEEQLMLFFADGHCAPDKMVLRLRLLSPDLGAIARLAASGT